MTLKNAKCVIKVGNKLFEPFNAKRDFRQGHSLSCDFFNNLMERIIYAAGIRHTGTIFYKRVMPQAYADDIDIIGGSECEVAVAFSKFAEEARNIDLVVNESNTKYLLSTAKDTSIAVYVDMAATLRLLRTLYT